MIYEGVSIFFLSWNKEVWLASCNPFSTLEPGIYSKGNLTQITSLCPLVCWLRVAPRWSPPITRYEVVPAHLSSALVPPPMCSLMQTYWLEILCVLCSFISVSLLLSLLIICMVLLPLLFACLFFFFNLNWMLFLPEFFPWTHNLTKCFLYVSL